MLTVVIETSTERGAVGIAECHKDKVILLGEEILPFGYQNSKFILPAIERLCLKLAKKPRDMAYITLGIGPGSYTGLRVGAAVAKTWGYACCLPIVGVCSLRGFIPEKEGPFAAMVDAKIGGVYLLQGNKEKEKITYLTPPSLIPLDHLPTKLQGIEQWVTPSSAQLLSRFSQFSPTLAGNFVEISPDVVHMAKEGWTQYQSGDKASAEEIQLLYLRKTQAEIEKDKARII